jgi:hypothetical protein
MKTEKKQVSDAEEGAPSTNAAAGGQAGNVVATSRDQSRSRVDRQANGCTPTPGEARNDGMEVNTRSPQGTSDRPEGVFLTPAMVGDAMSLTGGGFRMRTRSDDEESATPAISHMSLDSTEAKGKKRRLISLTPDVSEELVTEVRMSSAADVSAEVTRQVAEIMRVARTSSNLKGTYVKALKDAAGYITTAWQNQALQSVRPRAIAKDCLRARMPTV